jgi:HK97 gp10 family phage protein
MARNRAVLQVRGVAELADAMALYGAAVVRQVASDAEGIVSGTAATIRQAAPFDPTPDKWLHVREQVSARITYSPYGFLGRITVAGRVAHLQEFGTAHHEAQPFFVPAVRAARDRLEAAAAAAVRRLAPRDLGTPRVTARTGTSSTPLVGIE